MFVHVQDFAINKSSARPNRYGMWEVYLWRDEDMRAMSGDIIKLSSFKVASHSCEFVRICTCIAISQGSNVQVFHSCLVLLD